GADVGFWGRSGNLALDQSTAGCDPNVWSGRALQEDFSEWHVRSCINVSGLCLEPFVPRAIMDISAPAISLAVRPQWAIWVTSVRMRREDRSSISSSSRQTSAGKTFRQLALRSRGLNLGCLEYTTMSQDAPSNASELVGERDSEDVVM